MFRFASGGGSTVRALLLAPEVYHVGIAGRGAGGDWSKANLRNTVSGLPPEIEEGDEYKTSLQLFSNFLAPVVLPGEQRYADG